MTADKEYEILCTNLKELMSRSFGRDVIWEILSMCGIYTDNSALANPGVEGKRSIGLQILQMLEDADPTMYAQLLLTKQSESSNE